MYILLYLYKINLMIKSIRPDINKQSTKNGFFYIINSQPGGSGLLKMKVNFINIDYLF